MTRYKPMTWIVINIIFFVAGILLIIASQFLGTVNACTPVPEDIFDIIEILVGGTGAVLLAIVVISEPLRWWLG
jgi:hypothetical protein